MAFQYLTDVFSDIQKLNLTYACFLSGIFNLGWAWVMARFRPATQDCQDEVFAVEALFLHTVLFVHYSVRSKVSHHGHRGR